MPRVYPNNPKCTPSYSKGSYVNETFGHGYEIDNGKMSTMRSGWQPHGSLLVEIDNITGKLDFGLADLAAPDGHGGYIPVKTSYLLGKSVAFYFAAIDHPKCTSFTPFLKQFYKSINESGSEMKIEIIFVSLDSSKETFEKHRASMPWLSIQYGSDHRYQLIKRYGLKHDTPSPTEAEVIELLPSTGLPRLLVVGDSGQQIHWLSCEHYGPQILKEWDFYAHRWGEKLEK